MTQFDVLKAISPLDGRYHDKTEPLQAYASEYALIKYRLIVELRWLETLADKLQLTSLDQKDRTLFQNCIDQFTPEQAQLVKQYEATTRHDVKALEYYLQEQLKSHGELSALIPFIHFACTSEDINNVAYALMLRDLRETILLPQLDKLIARLRHFAHQYADLPMLARTHGQAATPTTLGKEFANVIARLQRQYEQLSKVELLAKFNGASGNFNAHCIAYPEINWLELSTEFLKSLDLSPNLYTTQIEPHDFIAELLHNQTRINNILIDFSRDTWHYISINYFTQLSKAHEVGSSTMPHKINPIDFENAEGNLGLANALMDHLANKLPISRLQRDLSDSTVLRNLGSSFAYVLVAYQSLQQGLSKLKANTAVIAKDLAQHPEILAEAIQTVMRRYGHTDAYEQLKALTRGNTLDQAALIKWLKTLDLPKEAKQALLSLTPEYYLGLAVKLAQQI